MSTATKEAMEQLHAALADQMKAILVNGVTVLDDEGKPVRLTPGANYLNAIRQFLKDNNIEAQAGRPGSSFNDFVGHALPFIERDENQAGH